MKKGFTLIELLVTMGIFVLLVSAAFPALRVIQQRQSVDQEAQKVISALRGAQNKTLASEGSAVYGIYIDTAANPHRYIVFKGSSFADRDVSADETHAVGSGIEFFNVNVPQNQVVFDRLTGATAQQGTISLRLKSDGSQARTVYIEGIGQIGMIAPISPPDSARIKDSRHALIDYAGRVINTSTENMQLIFPGLTQDIPIANNMSNGQISWSGTIAVSGQNQTIAISTYTLNDNALHTQFSVHRDRRYNTQSLTIQLTGDASGNLIHYDASGQTTKGTSIYAANPIWQ